MEHSMNLNPNPYAMIKNGLKDIELRLYDEKRRLISKGDIIVFTNIETKEKIKVLVKELHIYKNYEELYPNFEKTRLGYLEDEEANPKDMEEYYSIVNIEKYGVVGIEVVVL